MTGAIDVHGHWLPGVDDGAKDVATAVELLRAAAAEGITTAVATPHTKDGVYDVPRAQARAAHRTLTAALAEAGVAIELRLAAEVHLHESVPALLEESPDVSLDGSGRWLLLELPHQTLPATLPQFLFGLQTTGITPLIAHPERNLVVRDDPEITADWVERGVKLQVTAGSLTGAFGPVIARCAEHLLAAGRVHVLATDSHSLHKRPPIVRDALAAAARVIGDDGARALFHDHPSRILAGAPADAVIAPRPRRRRRWLLARSR